ncbi:hypothetical protein [Nonomuraea basaltis]|uniref:hypothetical protein n=1 Tax=Nonomuraea basaltis TaxID=2495887 RepID=UPI00110C3F53|nr:hypothetical protein [Nonomuraea basaltis]TMR95317.1 hypothetical protein EJK15_29065 [Nonomuraea basaltis]
MNRSLGIGLMGVMLGMITAPLDGMMLGPALPTIVGDLGGLEYFSWVATAYLICMAAATPIWGSLAISNGRLPTGELRAELDRVRRLGVTGVPVFLIEGLPPLAGSQTENTLFAALKEAAQKKGRDHVQ